ncbi:FGGY family carbohydrate kinase [Actinomyces sp. B33]|uniref:FGGY family carbohydrate kinase n=1 Tax=Actinomyces sp. B33 TaxID=2942131 RepID=UPI0023412424|nr:FGGY family carbohydrate kinase [Actinomyces sp. B33]MDC4232479.1 FGGY family carbohydrate kinase [Actinomyces sp. B33]
MAVSFVPASDHDPHVEARRAQRPLVLAIDIGSTSVRTCVFDARGRALHGCAAERRHDFATDSHGASVIDADLVVDGCAAAIGETLLALGRTAVDAVAADSFASSFICVDAAGDALTPCLTYADSRSWAQLDELRARVDEDEIHQLTGARLHTSYHAPKFAWLREESPGLLDKTAAVESIGTYVVRRLTGRRIESISSAAWSGLLDRRGAGYCDAVLGLVDARPDWFAPLADPTQRVAAAPGSAASRWPQAASAQWFAPVPDGLASNWGVGAIGPSALALSAATSGAMRVLVPSSDGPIPRGLWSYRVSHGDALVGGALNDVGRVLTWWGALAVPLDTEDRRRVWSAPPVDGAPVFLPFLTGERSTGWAGRARAGLSSVTAATGPREAWRAVGEGLALSYLRIHRQLVEAGARPDIVLASGGVVRHYPEILPLVADCLGVDLAPVVGERITMRGAALMAVRALLGGEADYRVPVGEAVRTRGELRGAYDSRLEAFEEAYRAAIGALPGS